MSVILLLSISQSFNIDSRRTISDMAYRNAVTFGFRVHKFAYVGRAYAVGRVDVWLIWPAPIGAMPARVEVPEAIITGYVRFTGVNTQNDAAHLVRPVIWNRAEPSRLLATATGVNSHL